jgi:glycosyltransferase involved in cell wall biosynthesis
MMNFSVLMSVYSKEDDRFLDLALESLFDQTLPAQEVVLVEDGSLTEELYSVIEKWKDKLPLKTVKLEHNVGLGKALNIGLNECSNNIVARMDTDDIAKDDRFEKQINFFKDNPDADILGASILEFDKDITEVSSERQMPITHDEILKFAKYRNPFNHMTVMYKKDKVLAAGSYLDCPYFEDYFLWLRMLKNGAKTANLRECLVYARIGNDMLGRRHGWGYFKHEISFWYKTYTIGYNSLLSASLVLFMRAPIRLLPMPIYKLIYNKILRKG